MRFYSERKTVMASTFGIAYEIYVSGCNNGKGYCEGCHSEHTWDPSVGVLMDASWYDNYIMSMKRRGDFKFDNINLVGGEPLDNTEEDIRYYCKRFGEAFPDKGLWLYTHFNEEELEAVFPYVYDLFDYIKVGKFDIDKIDEEYDSWGISLISTNQYIVEGRRDDKE